MLTDQQKEIILSKERHSVVLAGAGSGKTFTIVERVHELLSRGVQPSSIVILTFSRAAARELKQRIGEGKVHIGTFHSFILPFIDPKPNVLSEEESDELVLEAAFATGAAVKKVSGVKNVSGNQNVWRKEAHGRWPTALGKYYASQLALRGDIDYTGILHAGLKLVRDGVICPEYVIVDEAQDNDGLQWDITQAFAELASVMCVGDINQCIHLWRSATPERMENLPWKRYPLTETFRCFSAIVDEANSIDGVTIKLSTKKIGGMVHKSDTVSLDDVISSLSNNNIEDVAVLCPYNVDVQWWKENLEREGVQVAEKWAEVGPVHYLLKWLACPTGSSRKKAAQAMAGCEAMHEIIPLLNGSKSDTSVAILAQSWLSSLGVSYGPEEVLRKFSFPMTLWGEAKQISEAYRGETLDSWYANECLSKGMETKSQGLSVSTIHGAKGLEWDMVFMTKTPKDYRLNYVGTTRAKSVLVKGN